MMQALTIAILGLIATGSVMVAPRQTTAATASRSPRAEDLAWIGGCWTMATPGGGVVEETWLPPAGGAMVGVGRTIRGGQMTEYEFLVIRHVDGHLAYVAKPSGQAEATFPVLRTGAAEVVFENPTHDFPQRIIYKKNADGSMTARIEGQLNGQSRGIDFPYGRCK